MIDFTAFNTPALYGFGFSLAVGLSFGLGLCLISVLAPFGHKGRGW